MKKSILSFISVVLFSILTIESQTNLLNWNEVSLLSEKELPASVLSKTDSLLAVAISNRYEQDILVGYSYKVSSMMKIEPDSAISLLQQLENLRPILSDKTNRAVLDILLANGYLAYYRSMERKISAFTSNREVIKEDAGRWGKREFLTKILALANASLEHSEVLKGKASTLPAAIFNKGDYFREAKPTLCDLIAGEVIVLLSDGWLQRQIEELLPDHPSVKRKVSSIYADLINFHRSVQRTSSVFVYQLEQLQFEQEGNAFDQTDKEYIRRLDDLISLYDKYPYVAEAIHAKCVHLLQSDSDIEKYGAFKKLVETIGRFPHYQRIGVLINLKNALDRVELSSKINRISHPKAPIEVELTLKGTDDIKYEIYKLDSKSLSLSFPSTDDSTTARAMIRRMQIKPSYLNEIARYDTIVKLPRLSPGIYLSVLSAEGGKYESKSIFYVSRFAEVIRRGEGERTEFYLFDRLTGRPQPDGAVALYKRENSGVSHIETIKADKDGLVVTSNRRCDYYRVVSSEEDTYPLAYLPNYYYPQSEHRRQYQSSLFTDRAIYRPGQTVYFKAITWQEKEQKQTAINGRALEVKLMDANGEQVSSSKHKSNEFGSISGSFLIPLDRLLGNYSIVVSDEARAFFEVAEYKRPSFEVLFDGKGSVLKLDTLCTIEGEARSFDAVPVEGATVKYKIKRGTFMPYRYYAENEITIQEGSVIADAKGAFSLSFTPSSKEGDRRLRYRFTIDLDVTTAERETQTKSQTYIIGKPAYYVEVDAPELITKESIGAISLRSYDLNRKEINIPLNYELYMLNRSDSLLVERGSADSNFKVNGKGWSKLKSGKYRMDILSTDGKCGSHSFILFSTNEKRFPVDTCGVVKEIRTAFSSTDPAQILFATTAKPLYIWMELFKENERLERKQLVLSNEIRTLTIPYQENYGKEVTLQLTYVYNQASYSSTIKLKKEEPGRALSIKFITFRDKTLPGSHEEWKLRVTNEENRPVEAELLASLFDDSLTGFARLDWFLSPFTAGNFYRYLLNVPYSNAKVDARPYFQVPLLPETAIRYDRAKPYGFEFPMYGGFRFAAMGSRANHMMSAKTEAVNDAAVSVGSVFPSAAPKTSSENKIRENFAENQLFYPFLRSDSLGVITVNGVMGDAITRWRLKLLAHTKDMSTGSLDTTIVTSKEIQIKPLLPKFMMQGDSLRLNARVLNLSESSITLSSRVELFHPITKVVSETIALTPFECRVAANQSNSVSAWLKVPFGAQRIGLRFIAESASHTDTEEHILDIHSNQIELTSSQPFTVGKAGESAFALKDFSHFKGTLLSAQVEVMTQPMWMVVESLPVLVKEGSSDLLTAVYRYFGFTVSSHIFNTNAPIREMIRSSIGTDSKHGLQSQTYSVESRLQTPWLKESKNEQLQREALQTLFDRNTFDAAIRQASNRLTGAQNADGGWGWCPRMESTPYITLTILRTLGQMTEMGVHEMDEAMKSAVFKAVNYADRVFLVKKDKDSLALRPDLYDYLYIRSMFMDMPINSDLLPIHKQLMNHVVNNHVKLSLKEKAHIALAAHTLGFKKEAVRMVKSIKEHAQYTTLMGRYWGSSRSGSHHSQESVMLHTLLLEACAKVEPNKTEEEQMRFWLLRRKQTQSWITSMATVSAVHSLLTEGATLLDKSPHMSVSFNGAVILNTREENITTKSIHHLPVDQVKAKKATLIIKKEDNVLSFGSIYYTTKQKISDVATTSDVLKIFKEVIPTGNAIKAGERVRVRLQITSERDMQYLLVKDQLPTNLIPVKQLSEMCYDKTLRYYREVRDESVNLFIDFLPKGSYQIEYDAFVTHDGYFEPGVCQAESIYAPEFRAYSLPQ